jgi:hypothetical protein
VHREVHRDPLGLGSCVLRRRNADTRHVRRRHVGKENRPKPEHEQDLIDSMHRFGAAARAQGAIEAHTFKDERSDALVGLAIWRSDEDLAAARPALGTATEQDDFDAWESGPVELFLLHDV